MHFGHLIERGLQRNPQGEALRLGDDALSYGDLAAAVRRAARAFVALGLRPGDRVAIYLSKSFPAVISLYAAGGAGGVFVPVNPVLKPRQVRHVLSDSGASVLVTSSDRLAALKQDGEELPETLRSTVCVDGEGWEAFLAGGTASAELAPAGPDDLAALLYTSGSTGLPKGVMLSHENLVLGAESVASYLANTPEDRILCALPLSFDYGLSQVSTAFLSGATAVLVNHLFPQDIVRAMQRHAITGLACVPPLWLQVLGLDWPEEVGRTLRYATNSGGRMPRHAVESLRQKAPDARIFLMYGLTEAFRSTYLDPAEVERRPDSIGRPIPHARIHVVTGAGEPAGPGEAGELVHAGPLVAQGYWNDPERTAARFRPLPERFGDDGPAVWSGDTVRRDEEGFLYFVERQDNMIKTSGYRVSPTEVEEVLYECDGVTEAAVVGVAHEGLGAAIVGVIAAEDEDLVSSDQVIAHCRSQLPAFMVPRAVVLRDALPRNANGKIDRVALAADLAGMFGGDR